MEDEEVAELTNEDDDSFDSEAKVVSQEWMRQDFAYLVIAKGASVPWDYTYNEVVQGARYRIKDEVKNVVKCWSLFNARV